MVSDFTLAGQWLLDTFTALWSAFGSWGFFGFAVIFFPLLRKLVRLFRSLVNSV